MTSWHGTRNRMRQQSTANSVDESPRRPSRSGNPDTVQIRTDHQPVTATSNLKKVSSKNGMEGKRKTFPKLECLSTRTGRWAKSSRNWRDWNWVFDTFKLRHRALDSNDIRHSLKLTNQDGKQSGFLKVFTYQMRLTVINGVCMIWIIRPYVKFQKRGGTTTVTTKYIVCTNQATKTRQME